MIKRNHQTDASCNPAKSVFETMEPRRLLSATGTVPPAMYAVPPVEVAGVASIVAVGSTALRVNVGGTIVNDSASNVWVADKGASGGTVPSTSIPVAKTTDDYLYSSRRWGNFSYHLPADDGNYTLKLLFVETAMTGANQRLFNVSAEGRAILMKFDLFAAAGYQSAFSKSFPITVTGNSLDLTFTSIKDHAIVSAIELDPVDAQTSLPGAPTSLVATGSTSAVQLSWKDNSNNEAGFEIDRQGPGQTGFVRIATVPSNVTSYNDTGLKAGTSYIYQVRAVNNRGSSACTSAITASTSGASAFTHITWTSLSPSPVPRGEAQTAVVNGKMYVFGGYTTGASLPSADSDYYNPASNTWTAIASMPTGETHAGCCADDRYVYMAGGYTGPGAGGHQTFATTNVFRYDTTLNQWANLPALPQARGGGAMALLGRTLHFFGGSDLSRHDRNEHWTLNLDNPAAGWQSAAPLPTLRNHMGAVALNGKIYAVGGQQNQDAKEIPQSAVQMWDPAKPGVWTTMASLPQARSHIAGATFVFNGRIIVLGGETTYLDSINTASAYDPATNQWVNLTPLPASKSSGCANVINGILYYVTGNVSKTVYRGVPG